MKRIISLILGCALLLTACGPNQIDVARTDNSERIEVFDETIDNSQELVGAEKGKTYTGLDDDRLLMDVENVVYEEMLNELGSEDYFIENVEAIYYPKEYIEELAFNSKENIYFGYTVSELNKQFQGEKYVFTMGENGETVAVPMKTIEDTVMNEVMTDVVVGTGVILFCVTVSTLTAGTGLTAINAIFACSANSAITFAKSGAVIGGISAAIVTAYATEDFEKAVKSAAIGAADGFKWGAVIGSVASGAKEAVSLKGMTTNGLTMNEAALIQKESKWPIEAIKSLHSKAEYEIYKKCDLMPVQMSDGSWAFLRKIDWTLVDNMGRTNVERVSVYKIAPIDASGKPYELHHIGMRADSPLAILTNAEHHSTSNYKTLHYKAEGKGITDTAWKAQKQEFWDMVLAMTEKAGI